MVKNSSGSKPSGSYRSAISGRYVTASYGKTHPKTTVKEFVQEVRRAAR